MNKPSAATKGELPATESTFVIEVIGDFTQKRFVGEFTCKILNQKERALVSKHRAMLNGEHFQQLDIMTLSLHQMISYLRYSLIPQYPKFWQDSDLGYELFDLNVIREVFNQVMEFEESWFVAVWGEDHLKKLRSDEKAKPEPETESSGNENPTE